MSLQHWYPVDIIWTLWVDLKVMLSTYALLSLFYLQLDHVRPALSIACYPTTRAHPIWHSTTSQDKDGDEDAENESKPAFGDHDTEKPEQGSSEHNPSPSSASSSSISISQHLGTKTRTKRPKRHRLVAECTLSPFSAHTYLTSSHSAPSVWSCCNLCSYSLRREYKSPHIGQVRIMGF